MKCRECIYRSDFGKCIYMGDFGNGLDRCTNRDSMMYMEYAGVCYEDECPDEEPLDSTEKEVLNV